MAPEMVTSKAYGAKVDIWSFGCLVLEMFTGQQPWKGYAPHQALFTVWVLFCKNGFFLSVSEMYPC